MEVAIGVDIGGSGFRVGRVVDGVVQQSVSEAVGAASPDEVIARVAESARALAPGAPVGVGVPGWVRDGVVLGLPNRPGWEGLPLADRLATALGVPVVVDNDATAAAAGGWWTRGRPSDLAVLTLGTGVGGGLIAGGRLVRGGGTAGEIGHLWIGGDRRCGCGSVGCLETRVGTVGLRAGAAERGRVVDDGLAVIEAARRGEAWAEEVVADAADALGKGLANLANLLDPDELLLVGGLAGARDQLGPGAEAELRRRAVRPAAARVRLTWGGRADDLAMVGAALMASGEVAL